MKFTTFLWRVLDPKPFDVQKWPTTHMKAHIMSFLVVCNFLGLFISKGPFWRFKLPKIYPGNEFKYFAVKNNFKHNFARFFSLKNGITFLSNWRELSKNNRFLRISQSQRRFLRYVYVDTFINEYKILCERWVTLTQ